jgi:hypothetical protein
MTTPTCHAAPFTSRRTAARRAWLLADQGRTVEPFRCDHCNGWHLRTTATPTPEPAGSNA